MASNPIHFMTDATGGLYFVRGDDRRPGETVLVGADSRTQHPGLISVSWQTVHRDEVTGPIRRAWVRDAQGGGPDGA
jgi:hypothetical protein